MGCIELEKRGKKDLAAIYNCLSLQPEFEISTWERGRRAEKRRGECKVNKIGSLKNGLVLCRWQITDQEFKDRF